MNGRQIEHELQHAAALAVHRGGDRRQLVLAGLQGRRVIAGRGAVIEGARGREAERAGAHRLTRQRRHRLVVLGCGGIAARAALAHHINAERGMRQLRADVDVEIALRQPVHVIGETLPRPRDAGAQDRLRNILDAFHQLDQAEMIGGLQGAKPTPQLPMTAVVTPFCEDGVMSWLQVTWPS